MPSNSQAPTDHLRVAQVRCTEGDSHLRLQLRVRDDHKTLLRPVSETLEKLRSRLQIVAAAAATSKHEDGERRKSKKERGRIRKKNRRQSPTGTDELLFTTEQEHSSSSPHDGMQALSMQQPPEQDAVRFFRSDGYEFVSKNLPIGDVLMQTARIEIGDVSYVVLHNQPLVLKLSVADPVLAGIPIAPIVETEFCSPDECVWRWFRIRSSAAVGAVDGDTEEELCGDKRRHLPTDADIGCRFRVECHAPSAQEAYAHDSKTEIVTPAVVHGPNREVFQKRERLGRMRAHESGSCSAAFRVMTYNILFNGYVASAQRPLFPYASAAVLSEMYRMQLVFQEIEECNADIVCLQEVGEATFTSFFTPALEPASFHTFFSGKTGSTQEGCAVLVRTDAFEIVEEHTVDLSMVVKHSPDPTVRSLLTAYPELAKAFDKIPSVAQLMLLRSKRDPSKHLVLSNTHLFYRPDAHVVRLLQTVAMVREASKLRLDTGGHVGLLLCGDLNAFPGTAPIHFLLNSRIDSSHPHWQDAARFKWKLAESSNTAETEASSTSKIASSDQSQSAKNSDPSRSKVMNEDQSRSEEDRTTLEQNCTATDSFEHDLALESACGIPEFTNFAGTFVATLDYILLSHEHLHVQQVFPLFTTEEVSAEVALPSSRFPSDHISLVCDIGWEQSNQS